MKKVFLLLRDNVQSGPFTIDELLQQKLSADDLIWVEGFSHAWCPPSELDLLKLSFAGTAPSIDVKPHTPTEIRNGRTETENYSLVKNKKKRKWAEEDIEGRAEEIRRRTLEYVSSKSNTTSPLITDDEIRSFVKTPDIDFVVHKKSRGVSANFIGAFLVALMLFVGWYGKDKFFIAQNNAGQLTTQDVAPQVIPISSTVQMIPSTNESAAFIQEAEDSVITEVEEEPKSFIPTNKPVEQKPAIVASTPDNSNKIMEDAKSEKQPVKEIEDPIKVQPEKKETAAVSSKIDSTKTKDETKAIEETETSIEKKKTLGQAIKGIFKKKKKDKDTEEDENDN